MLINFSKISHQPYKFDISEKGVKFTGEIIKKSQNICELKGRLDGILAYICDRCGENFNLKINETVNLILSNGIFKDDNHEISDVIEFLNGVINLDEILQSEIEAYKSGYFYCDKCKNL